MATSDVTDIDHDALRVRYRAERDKRLRHDGNDQYLEPTGRFSHFLDDPYVTVADREPKIDEVDVAIIGAGFAGLVTGARLKQAGVQDVWLIDGAGDVGGAWYWNRYPGAMCDTAAMIYLPLLEETGHMPSAKYTQASEIFGQAQRIAKTFHLYDRALFSTEVTDLRWDENSSRWIVSTNRGDQIKARFVASGTGPLHRPKLPGVPGIETYEGHCFHTSRWDYAYTGGDASGAKMTNLTTKRVGIIGTGATAVQAIPVVARDAGELFVFQRTPSSIDERNNHNIDPEWFGTLEPGWQKKWQTNFATLQTGGFADEDLVKDGWTDISQRVRDRVVSMLTDDPDLTNQLSLPEISRLAYEDSDDEKMQEIRARVDNIVNDVATADALKPWYRQLCKRPCFHDEYLASYNLPNVHLVDTDGQGVERIDATGVWVDGVHYDLDCLIFASGFEVGTEQARRSGFETTGRNGLELTEYWAKGMKTMHGLHSNGFPNLFILGVSHGAALLSNVTHNFVEAGSTIAAIIAHAQATNAHQVEVTANAENEWMTVLGSGRTSFMADPDCTPGYYNNEGRPIGDSELLVTGGYPASPVAYFQFIEEWRDNGLFSGLEFRPGH